MFPDFVRTVKILTVGVPSGTFIFPCDFFSFQNPTHNRTTKKWLERIMSKLLAMLVVAMLSLWARGISGDDSWIIESVLSAMNSSVDPCEVKQWNSKKNFYRGAVCTINQLIWRICERDFRKCFVESNRISLSNIFSFNFCSLWSNFL